MRLRCAWADSGARTGCALLILLLILALPALASEPKFPPLTGRVVDDAGVLNASTRGELTDMLAEHERATGEQVVVVTLESLQGYPIEDYGYQLGRHWGIGQKGTNTGALLIVVPKERKVRIEVGYGLEGMLTDTAAFGFADAIGRFSCVGELLSLAISSNSPHTRFGAQMAVDKHQSARRLARQQCVGVADLLQKPAEHGGLARRMAAPVARVRNQLACGNAPENSTIRSRKVLL